MILLVTSGGGHLAHLMALRPWWEQGDRAWVALDNPDARDRLVGEAVTWERGPTNRDPRAVLRVARRAPGVFRRLRPTLVVSAGAAIALPYLAVARAVGIPGVFVEVIDRVDRPSWTGRLAGPLATEVLVHWPEQRAFHPGATVLGPLWGGP